MFQPGNLYRPDDAEMQAIATVAALAKWRHFGSGPAYIKAGGRILYRGEDILDWMERQTVRPTQRQKAA